MVRARARLHTHTCVKDAHSAHIINDQLSRPASDPSYGERERSRFLNAPSMCNTGFCTPPKESDFNGHLHRSHTAYHLYRQRTRMPTRVQHHAMASTGHTCKRALARVRMFTLSSAALLPAQTPPPNNLDRKTSRRKRRGAHHGMCTALRRTRGIRALCSRQIDPTIIHGANRGSRPQLTALHPDANAVSSCDRINEVLSVRQPNWIWYVRSELQRAVSQPRANRRTGEVPAE